MMEITNAKIKSVTVGFDDRDRLSASMTFEGRASGCNWGFILTNPRDVQRLIKLMNYTDSYEVNDLNGKIIRKVDSDNCFRGFGHPTEDKFIPVLTEEFMEINESEFGQLLENN